MISLGELGDVLLAEVVADGYPILAFTLLVSAVGLPLPSGLAMALAGALSAQGELDWIAVALVALVALTVGDALGYGLGWLAGRGLLERHGRWIWLTPERLRRAEEAFTRHGALSVVASRSVLAPLSPAVNVLAGASRYRLRAFVPFGLVGRLPWVGAYLGLGYFSGENVEAAEQLLASLGGFLVALTVLAGLVYLAWTKRRDGSARSGGTAGHSTDAGAGPSRAR